MWLDILKNLKSHMSGMADVKVLVGASLENDYPRVELLRGDTSEPVVKNRLVSAKHKFYVDVWVRNDELDPQAAYEELYKIENSVLSALVSWFAAAGKELGVTVTKAEVEGIACDFEEIRPVCASRFIFSFEWRKKA